MLLLPLTLESPAANVALDEALLDAAVAGELVGPTLRLWESPEHLVVLGRSSPPTEVDAKVCRSDGVTIVRRSSGGQAVVAGPGCLLYAVVLPGAGAEGARPAVDAIHDRILGRLATALAPLAPGVVRAGVSDLALPVEGAVGLKKFSGNSLRIKRGAILYHGSLLYDFDLPRIARWLGPPARRPAYRGERSHGEFLVNFPASRAALETALAFAWRADRPAPDWPRARLAELLAAQGEK